MPMFSGQYTLKSRYVETFRLISASATRATRRHAQAATSLTLKTVEARRQKIRHAFRSHGRWRVCCAQRHLSSPAPRHRLRALARPLSPAGRSSAASSHSLLRPSCRATGAVMRTMRSVEQAATPHDGFPTALRAPRCQACARRNTAIARSVCCVRAPIYFSRYFTPRGRIYAAKMPAHRPPLALRARRRASSWRYAFSVLLFNDRSRSPAKAI